VKNVSSIKISAIFNTEIFFMWALGYIFCTSIVKMIEIYANIIWIIESPYEKEGREAQVL